MKPILITAIMAFAISAAPGQERFFIKKNPELKKNYVPNQTRQGDLVAADNNGVLTMDNSKAKIHGSIKPHAPGEALNALSYWDRDSDWLEWNLDIPFDGDYFVDFSWTAGEDQGKAAFRFTCGDAKVDWNRPKGWGWDRLLASRIGKMSLKKGKAVFELKKTLQGGKDKGTANVMYVKLVPVAKDHDKQVQSIAAKSSIDFTPRERETVWGPCATIFSLQSKDSLPWVYRYIAPLASLNIYCVGDTFYTVTVFRQRNIVLDIARQNMTSKEALELVKTILPKAKFKITRKEMDTSRFTLTSQDRDKTYDLEFWEYNDLRHITIHNQKLAIDMLPRKTTRLKTCMDSMYKAIAQNAQKAGRKDLFKRNWMDLNEKDWIILMGGPSAGKSTILKPSGWAHEWIFDTMSLKAQFDQNGKFTCLAINTPFEIFPRDMISFASKLLPSLFFESPDSTLGVEDGYAIKARGPQGRKYQCFSERHNYNTDFSITPISAATPGATNNSPEPQTDKQPPQNKPIDYSKLGL